MNELALKDIHLPSDSLWWPPAPGWWMLLALLIFIGYLLPKFFAWIGRKPIKAVCLREFNRIRQTSIDEDLDDRQVIKALSVLLRRTAMSYGARETDASLSGDRWVARLNQMSGDPCFSSAQFDLLTRGQYRQGLEVDIDGLLHSCENWIKSLPKWEDHAAN